RLLANRGDADQEVLEIFIEEAEEEVAKINLNRVIWKDDEENEDALTIIRRSFHTLKGGGRLIGAEIVGEYAWQIENILNRVIDKSFAVTNGTHNLLENAVALLNELVLQLKTGREPAADVVGLFTAAQNYLEKNKEIPQQASHKIAEESDDELLDDFDAIATNIEVLSLDADEIENIE
ncbi:MAG: Hpt domain-containing protein, partial [Gammaproteobacteria bacterium]|nr:Hpt domain-containing protein [Gammaproteobacteria bacterium]